MWLETSHADPVSYRSSAAFLKVTRPPLAVDAIVLQNAGHRLALWQAILPRSLVWLGANVPGFAAGLSGPAPDPVGAAVSARGRRAGCPRVRSRWRRASARSRVRAGEETLTPQTGRTIVSNRNMHRSSKNAHRIRLLEEP